MTTWVTNCPDGFSKKVMANTKEEAVKMVMSDPEAMEHVKTKHQDLLATKTPEEMTAMMMSMTTPAA